jgi:hypothetical protein
MQNKVPHPWFCLRNPHDRKKKTSKRLHSAMGAASWWLLLGEGKSPSDDALLWHAHSCQNQSSKSMLGANIWLESSTLGVSIKGNVIVDAASICMVSILITSRVGFIYVLFILMLFLFRYLYLILSFI